MILLNTDAFKAGVSGGSSMDDLMRSSTLMLEVVHLVEIKTNELAFIQS